MRKRTNTGSFLGSNVEVRLHMSTCETVESHDWHTQSNTSCLLLPCSLFGYHTQRHGILRGAMCSSATSTQQAVTLGIA